MDEKKIGISIGNGAKIHPAISRTENGRVSILPICSCPGMQNGSLMHRIGFKFPYEKVNCKG